MSAPVARKFTHGNHYISLLALFRVLLDPDNNNGHVIGGGGEDTERVPEGVQEADRKAGSRGNGGVRARGATTKILFR